MTAFKNLFKTMTPSKIVNLLACIFSSLYLEAYLDLYILRFTWSRLLAFGCIFTICIIFSHTIRRFFKLFSPARMLLAISIAVLILARYEDFFFPSTQETFVNPRTASTQKDFLT